MSSLPNNKVLDWSKFGVFADDKINVTEKLKFVEGRIENIVGKGENAGFQHFLLFQQCFQKAIFSGSLKVGILWNRVKGNKFKVTIFLNDFFWTFQNQDFSTRSLKMSEESPSCKTESMRINEANVMDESVEPDNDPLEQYQLRRTWESR